MKFTINKILVPVILLMVLTNGIIAQDMHIKNMPTYDRAPWHPGFTLGFNSADFVIKWGPNINQSDSLQQVTSQSNTGLNLGILLDLKLGENFNFRFVPTLVFASRELDYTFGQNGVVQHEVAKLVQSTFAEFPLMLKFKSVRIDNFRIYVLGGIKYDHDFIAQNKVQDVKKQIVKLNQDDYGYEMGVGLDIYFEYFKLSPELKVFHSIRNMLVHEDTPFAKDLGGLFSKIFYLQFYFE